MPNGTGLTQPRCATQQCLSVEKLRPRTVRPLVLSVVALHFAPTSEICGIVRYVHRSVLDHAGDFDDPSVAWSEIMEPNQFWSKNRSV